MADEQPQEGISSLTHGPMNNTPQNIFTELWLFTQLGPSQIP